MSRRSGGGLEIGGRFTLVDGAGKTVTDRDLRGRMLLIYFGYTSCPDICPTTLTEVANALRTLGDRAADIQPVFISLDPERDTPAVVRDYAAAFTPKLLGLTGTRSQVDAAAGAYRVYHQIHRTGSTTDDYTVDHSSLLYLVGADGRFIGPIRADQTGAAMAADITKLRS